MAARNEGFETAGASPGQAEDWALVTLSSVVLHAPFDNSTEGIEDFEEGWTLPIAELILTQTDGTAQCGAIVGCSPAPLAPTPQARGVFRGAIPGSQAVLATVGVTSPGKRAALMFQTVPGAPGKTTWEAGNYVVRINTTLALIDMLWEDAYICRFDVNCGSLAVVGSLLAQGLSLSTAGVKSMTVSGALQGSTNSDDTIYIVLVFSNPSASQPNIGITPDQNIDTPLLPEAFNEDSLFVLGPPNVAFALFGGIKPVDNFEDGWANDAGLLDDFDALSSEAATFDSLGTSEDFEDFEERWNLPEVAGPPFNEASEFNSGEHATGSITTVAVELINDGETFTLDDGINTAIVFELNRVGGFTPGNVPIQLAGLTLAGEMRDAIIAAVNNPVIAGAPAPLLITASSGGSASVQLVHDVEGPIGNVAITENVTEPTFVVSGMSGGVDNVTFTAALFDSTPQSFEDFENEWRSNEDSIFAYVGTELQRFGLGTALSMGSYDLNTDTYTDGAAYTVPAFAKVLIAEVTTTLGSLPVPFSMDYLDSGVAGPFTGTVTVPASATAGERFEVLEDPGATNPGFQDIGAVTESVAQQLGVVEFFGFEKDIEDFEDGWTLTLPT